MYRFCSIARTKNPIEIYKDMRVYQHLSYTQIANRLLYYQLISIDPLVNNFSRLYSNPILKPFIKLGLYQFVAPLLVGGKTTEDVAKFVQNSNYGSIVSFVGEGVVGNDQEHIMDRNAQIFMKSIDSTNPNQRIIAIKVSALKTHDLIQRGAQLQQELNQLWKSLDSEEVTTDKLLQHLQAKYKSITDDDLQQFKEEILENRSSINEVDWRTLVHTYYYVDHQKNANTVIRKINQYTNNELSELRNVSLRINKVLGKAEKTNCKVLMDSEYSWLQDDIESITTQYQSYNEKQPLIFTTIQSYFVDSPQATEFEIKKAQQYNRKLAIKLVRGAYLKQEKNPRLSKSHKQTCQLYDSNSLTILRNLGEGNLILATQNDDSVQNVIDNLSQTQVNQVIFAQTLGLADHISYRLRRQGYQTAKLIMFGDITQLGGWLHRRAYEHREGYSTVAYQRELLLDEVYRRSVFDS